MRKEINLFLKQQKRKRNEHLSRVKLAGGKKTMSMREEQENEGVCRGSDVGKGV